MIMIYYKQSLNYKYQNIKQSKIVPMLEAANFKMKELRLNNYYENWTLSKTVQIPLQAWQ